MLSILELFHVGKTARELTLEKNAALPAALRENLRQSAHRLLENVPIFKNASSDLLDAAADCLTPFFCTEGESLFSQRSRGLYLIRTGSIELRFKDGPANFVTVSGEGFFGEDSLTGEPLIESAIALTNCDLFHLDMDSFLSLRKSFVALDNTIKKMTRNRTGKAAHKEIQPDKVETVRIKQIGNGVSVNWQQVSDARGYEVLRKDVSGEWSVVARVKELEYIDSNSESILSSYRVRAYNDLQLGPVSDEAFVPQIVNI